MRFLPSWLALSDRTITAIWAVYGVAIFLNVTMAAALLRMPASIQRAGARTERGRGALLSTQVSDLFSMKR